MVDRITLRRELGRSNPRDRPEPPPLGTPISVTFGARLIAPRKMSVALNEPSSIRTTTGRSLMLRDGSAGSRTAKALREEIVDGIVPGWLERGERLAQSRSHRLRLRPVVWTYKASVPHAIGIPTNDRDVVDQGGTNEIRHQVLENVASTTVVAAHVDDQRSTGAKGPALHRGSHQPVANVAAERVGAVEHQRDAQYGDGPGDPGGHRNRRWRRAPSRNRSDADRGIAAAAGQADSQRTARRGPAACENILYLCQRIERAEPKPLRRVPPEPKARDAHQAVNGDAVDGDDAGIVGNEQRAAARHQGDGCVVDGRQHEWQLRPEERPPARPRA